MRLGHGASTWPRPDEHISSAPYPSRSSRPLAEYDRIPPPTSTITALLIGKRDLDLVARRGRCHGLGRLRHAAFAPRRDRRWSPTRRALAIAVSAGFTALILGKKLVSTT